MPGPYAWGGRHARLLTCHPLLVTLFQRAIKRADLPHDMTVVCGHRGKADQDAAFAAGRSRVRWPRGKHNKTPSLAVDVVPFVGGKRSTATWASSTHAPAVKAEWAAMQAEGLVPDGVKLVWGGDWGQGRPPLAARRDRLRTCATPAPSPSSPPPR
jgi:peptidoglycan LD-endopeptidase CwlK